MFYINFRPPANGTNNQLNPSAKEFAPLQMSKSFDFFNKVVKCPSIPQYAKEIYQFLYQTIYKSILYIYTIYRSICLSIYLSTNLSFYLSIHLSINQSIKLSINPYQSIYRYTNLSIYLYNQSNYQSIFNLSFYLSIYQTIIIQFIYLTNYLFRKDIQ